MARFQAKQAERVKIYAKVALMAPSGGGKTYGALRLATGMAEEIKAQEGREARILFANTEGARGYYYANEFQYDIIDLEAPFNPEQFVDAIQYAEDEKYDIMIIDSTSHEWDGKGGCLELQQQAGGTYQAWGKVTPRHEKFINKIADTKMHLIATMRGKDQYVMNTNDKGRTSVEKLGVGAKQRDGFEYEFTCTFLIDQKSSMSEAQKDNTHIFEREGQVLLSEDHGKKIIKWANTSRVEPLTQEKPSATQDSTSVNMGELETIKAQLLELCTQLSSNGKKQEVVDTLKSIAKVANPNAIKDIDIAQKALEALKTL